jgi:hypothetical protein
MLSAIEVGVAEQVRCGEEEPAPAAAPIGHKALPARAPTEKVQMVSTQPELAVHCCTI